MAVATQSALRKYRSRIFKMIKTIQVTLKTLKRLKRLPPTTLESKNVSENRTKRGASIAVEDVA